MHSAKHYWINGNRQNIIIYESPNAVSSIFKSPNFNSSTKTPVTYITITRKQTLLLLPVM